MLFCMTSDLAPDSDQSTNAKENSSSVLIMLVRLLARQAAQEHADITDTNPDLAALPPTDEEVS